MSLTPEPIRRAVDRSIEGAMLAEIAIRSRRSVRAFRPTPVSGEVIEQILELAARAPSGSNIQPWRVFVLRDKALAALTHELYALSLSGDPGMEEYAYYPSKWREPYATRRRKVGWDLYGALGIERGDHKRMRQQLARNFLFFDAPVGLVFTIDRDLERGSWLDYGIFLQNIMIAARCLGLETCPQAAFNAYGRLIMQRLAVPENQMLVCCMALGHADLAAPENNFATEREPVTSFARFLDQLPGAASLVTADSRRKDNEP